MDIKNLIAYFFPRQGTISHQEKFLSSLGAFAAVLLVALISQYYSETAHFPFLAASMGASTILLLAAPHSPVSQPWPLLGGHMIAALVGITCARYVPNLYLAASLAVGLTVALMLYLRCLHPPGGGTALLVVIGGPKITAMGYQFALTPLLFNLALLLVMALIINRLIPGRHYPYSLSLFAAIPQAATAKGAAKLSFNQDDLLVALRKIDAYIDVTGEDLNRIYTLATIHAHRRKMGEIRCADIMTRDVVSVTSDADLETVWKLLRAHKIRGMPVLENGRVAGMVAIADFLKLADWRMCRSPLQQLKLLLRGQTAPGVARIMSSPAITVSEETHILDLFEIFAEKGINHLPVVDGEGCLTGILTRLDLLSALVGDVVE